MLFKVIRAENLPASDLNGKSDPFVKIYYDNKEVGTTPHVRRELNPEWNYEVSIALVHVGCLYIVVEVWDKDDLSPNDLLGTLRVPFPDWRPHIEAYKRRMQCIDQAIRQQQQHHRKVHQQLVESMRSRTVSHLRQQSQPRASMGRSSILNPVGEHETSRITLHRNQHSRSQGSHVHRRSRSLHSMTTTHPEESCGYSITSPTGSTSTEMEPMIPPILIWSRLIKGTHAQGRILCSIQFQERDFPYLLHHPYPISIHSIYLPQNPRFQAHYYTIPRAWHPDPQVRQVEVLAMHAGIPKDCFFPWNELVLYMIEEVTVTFHLNESNQGVLSTMVLTNYRLWFVPYQRVQGLGHEDVHIIAIGKILKATITQQKRGSQSTTVLELDTMDAGHYHVTLSPLSRYRESVREGSKEAEKKRSIQLSQLVAEITWLQLENSFCTPYDRNHEAIENKDKTLESPMLERSQTVQEPKSPPMETIPWMIRSFTTQLPLKESIPPSPVHIPTRRRIRYDPHLEFQRQGVLNHPSWRVCHANQSYSLCSTYPSYLIVPACLSDEIIIQAAGFRSKNRFPALTWIHPRTGAPLCRSSQPNTGMLAKTNSSDRELIWAIHDAAIPMETNIPKKSSLLHIVDARPELNAKSNALAGKGHESIKQYDRDGIPMTSLTFMGIDNIHVVRTSFHTFVQALYHIEDAHFFGAIQKSRWLEHVCGLLQRASEVVLHMERGDGVLVHCSDGWDRTAQLCTLGQLMMDPFYRTIEGFAILIEKDWCSFGHMFQKRCGHPTSDQTSPIFQQFVDAVYQLTLQFPLHFQFNELFLSTIIEAVYSSWYGTFQGNNEQERQSETLPTIALWDVIRASTDQYLNPLFLGDKEDEKKKSYRGVILPVCRVRVMQVWSSHYQKAISHMRLQQRESEMLRLIRQQENQLSRMDGILTHEQRLQIRTMSLRAEITSLSRSMNLHYLEEKEDEKREEITELSMNGSSSSLASGSSTPPPPLRRNSLVKSRSRSNSIRFKESLMNMFSGTSINEELTRDVLKRQVQQLESQIAQLHHQIAKKEEQSKHLLYRFRCYNYNVLEMETIDEEEQMSIRTHLSPSSSSSRDSVTRKLKDSSTLTPGSTALLTTTQLVTPSFRNAQPLWERDVDAPCCKRCKKKFKAMYRPRHHCRCCGFVFCGRCTSHRMNLPEFGYYDVVRVCITCYHSGEDS